MPILLVFALIAACLPVEWPEPPFAPERPVAALLTGSSVTLVLLIAFALRTWVIRTLRRDNTRRYEVARKYNAWRRTLFFLNLGTVAACVLVFGWGWLMQRELLVLWNSRAQMAPFAELAVPLPYFVVLLGCWLIYYDAERELHHSAGSITPFWPRAAYLLHNARNFALMVFLPVGLIVTKETIGRFAPETTQTLAYRIGTLCIVPLLILVMPLVMKPMLGLKSMPAGPTRTRFEELAKRLNFRCRDFLVWHTHGASTNAFITGLIPQVRYVVFTDRILEDLPPEELDAVFGHEVGHAKHGHIWFYMAFLTLSLSVLAAMVLYVAQLIDSATSPQMVELRLWLVSFKSWLAIPPVILVAGYLFVVFGALSRRCERQADLFGAKAVSCSTPVCDGHTAETVFPAGGRNLCRTGLMICAQALDRVRDLNGMERDTHEHRSLGQRLRSLRAWMRAWQHGPMPRRIAYLRGLTDKLAEERRFQRRVLAFKCVLMLLLVGALIALGQAVGWQDLFDSISV